MGGRDLVEQVSSRTNIDILVANYKFNFVVILRHITKPYVQTNFVRFYLINLHYGSVNIEFYFPPAEPVFNRIEVAQKIKSAVNLF